MNYSNEIIRENRDKWLEALKSGDYAKGTKDLRNSDDEYCCLGVACELFTPEKAFFLRDGVYSYEGCPSGASKDVINALGLYHGLGQKEGGNFLGSLAHINDNSDSFAPVIKAIETGEYWKPLD